jgi:hypothetical protein
MWLSNDSFFSQLNDYLMERVNAIISEKQKGNLSNQREYFQYRAKIEQSVIQNLVEWRSYFETCGYLAFPTQEDKLVLADSNNVSDSDIMTFNVILGFALRKYIDNYMENSENCQKLYSYYKLLKEETGKRETLAFYPHEDGFVDYLENRIWRHEEQRKAESARQLGNYCIHCGSENVASYNKKEWKCKSCGKRFRKH